MKTLHQSVDRGRGKAALLLVSARATAYRLVPGRLKTEAKSYEVTAIPQSPAVCGSRSEGGI
jgi:hypothetical protein